MRKQFGKKWLFTPMPVLIIGTYDADGNANAMNAAWGIQSDFGRVHIFLGPHRTTENLKLKRAFTVSFADRANVVSADYVGIVSGADVPDKIAKAGWHPVKSEVVDAPLFAELPLAIECKMIDLVQEPEGLILIGEVVGMSADEKILTNGEVDVEKLDPISYISTDHTYRVLGEPVGQAFKIGNALK